MNTIIGPAALALAGFVALWLLVDDDVSQPEVGNRHSETAGPSAAHNLAPKAPDSAEQELPRSPRHTTGEIQAYEAMHKPLRELRREIAEQEAVVAEQRQTLEDLVRRIAIGTREERPPANINFDLSASDYIESKKSYDQATKQLAELLHELALAENARDR